MSDAPRVIDVCGVYFDLAGWDCYLRTFADRSPLYLKVFGEALARHAGIGYGDYLEAFERDPHKAVEALLEGDGLDVSPEQHVTSLRAQGVAQQILHGWHARLTGGTTLNERHAEIAAAHPDVLRAWAGLDVADPDAAIAELEHCVMELGMRGGSIVHWWSGRPPRDPGCHALYTRAAQLGVPLWLHTGMNYAQALPFDYCSWADIDHIAAAHPDLRIIAGHGGWPWILEGIAVLQRQPNVYLDLSAHRPKHMRRPGSGWEPLLNYGRNSVAHKVMFGSVTWVHQVDIATLAQEVGALGIGEVAAEAWLYGNARRVLNP